MVGSVLSWSLKKRRNLAKRHHGAREKNWLKHKSFWNGTTKNITQTVIALFRKVAGQKWLIHSSKELRGLPDSDNPMNPINRVHHILKHFLNSHSSFDRDNLQSYLNLFAFVSNPPTDMLEKVERIIYLAFQNPKLLRYREFYRINTDFWTSNDNTMQSGIFIFYERYRIWAVLYAAQKAEGSNPALCAAHII